MWMDATDSLVFRCFSIFGSYNLRMRFLRMFLENKPQVYTYWNDPLARRLIHSQSIKSQRSRGVHVLVYYNSPAVSTCTRGFEMRIPFSGPNWVDLPLNLSLCCRQHLPWIYSNQSRHLQRAGAHLRSEWKRSYTNTQMHMEYTQILAFAHSLTRSTHQSSTFADCQPLQTDTSTSQDPSSPPMTGVSMAPLRSSWRHAAAPYISIPPSPSSPTARAPRSENVFCNSVYTHIHTHAHTYTVFTYKLLWQRQHHHSPFCAVLKWDTARIGVHVKSMCRTLFHTGSVYHRHPGSEPKLHSL